MSARRALRPIAAPVVPLERRIPVIEIWAKVIQRRQGRIRGRVPETARSSFATRSQGHHPVSGFPFFDLTQQTVPSNRIEN
jgi:hypothetical protein